jgi:hypothetical protein
MRVEIQVDLKPQNRANGSRSQKPGEEESRQSSRSREERRLRRIALARAVESAIVRCEFGDMADAARRCGVSRVRISRVLDELRTLGNDILN